MIFKQYAKVLLSEKTLTTRFRLPAHIAEGKTWAIVPKRAAPAWWFDPKEEDIPGVVIYPLKYVCAMTLDDSLTQADAVGWLDWQGFVQAKIVIDKFWRVNLHDMDRHDAYREGVKSVDEYAVLWDSINKGIGTRWNDNPCVWRISFHVPLEVHEAVMRVGKQAILAAAATAQPTAGGAQ